MSKQNPFNPKSKNPRRAAALVIAAILMLVFALFAFLNDYSVGPSIFAGLIIAFAGYLIAQRLLLRKIP